MLASLSIQNVVLIDHLNIEFRKGLCALTGETGAGKSILLDALGLALGARSESALVRKGTDQASVTAEFQIPKNHPCLKLLETAGLQGDTGLILRRSVGADGRSRAFINDQAVSIGFLKEIGETMVEIHGQFETQGLLNPSTHRQILDDYAGFENTLSTLWWGWQDAQNALSTMRQESEKAQAEEKYLRQALEDLDGLSPQAGEEEKLATMRERLMHRERVLEGLNAAYSALSGENDPIRQAFRALERMADKLGESGAGILAALERAGAETEEAIALIQSLSADMEDSEHNLESIDERLHDLRAQGRKHNCTVDELPAMRETLAGRLNLIEHADEALAAQMRKVESAREAYIKEAQKTGDARRKAGVKLDKLVQKELPPLKLDKARFLTQVEDLPESEWGESGMNRVRFLVATNPGAEAGPLNKIASGGEMARFMLALKVVMAEVGSAATLIFDEVDTGIGGAVADAVGERLARLAAANQVLVVTHAPQVAARAAHHYIVRKDGGKEVKTTVVPLNNVQARREEIARMLAGATITQEARAAADKLLETGT